MTEVIAIEGRGELRAIKSSRDDGTFDIVINLPLDQIPVAAALMPWVLDEIQFVLVNKTRNPIKGREVQKAEPKNNQAGGDPVIYFIRRGDGAIKIGFTTNMGSRFSALQTASTEKLTVVKTMPGSRRTETQLQTRFKHLNIEGEWFKGDEELLQFIDQL